MTKEQKQMKRYMTAIERRLNLPREVKVRVMTDLQSAVAERREAGQTDEQIYADLGDAKTVAAELNEQMKEYAYTRSKWRWAALAAAVIAAAVAKVFDFRPAAIIEQLGLRNPIYRRLAAYGHIGREELGVAWEKTDKVEALRAALAQ